MTKKIGIVVVTVVSALLVWGLFVAFTPQISHASMPVTTCVWPHTCGG